MGVSSSDFRRLFKFTISGLQTVVCGPGSGFSRELQSAALTVTSVMSLLYLAILSTSRRERNKFASVLFALPDNFYQAFTQAESMIYMVFSIHNQHTYIGETRRTLLDRFHEELHAGGIAARNGHGTRFALQIGRFGIQFWSAIPLALLGIAAPFHTSAARDSVHDAVLSKLANLQHVNVKSTLHGHCHSHGFMCLLLVNLRFLSFRSIMRWPASRQMQQ
jgi:hypothetical protein